MTDYKKLCEDLRAHAEYSEDGDYIDLFPYVEGFEELIAENDRLKKQVDVAVADLKKACFIPYGGCGICKNIHTDICKGCIRDDMWSDIAKNPQDLWAWRGEEDAE